MDLLDIDTYLKDLDTIFDNEHFAFFGKKIMVTGGLGLIGSAFVDYLLYLNSNKKANISIVVADIKEGLFLKKYKRFSNISYLFFDASADFNFDLDYDYIVHFAGIASPEQYINKPVETINSHLNGVQNILKKIKKTNTIFLYVSSSEVYGKKPSNESDEKSYGIIDLDNIRLSYAVSKQMCEMICKSYWSEYKNRVLIVRPGHVYGPTASPNDQRVSSSFCFDAAYGRDIVLKSDGSQIRSYCYSLDCVSAILFVLIHGSYGESYNIGAKEKISINDMAHIISLTSGVKLIRLCPTKIDKKNFNPMEDSSLNSFKLESLGFRYRFTAKEGFSHTIRILRKVSGQ